VGNKRKIVSSSRPPKRGTAASSAPNIIKGKLVEQVVALLHEEPGIKIETNVKLPPSDREIDVLITGHVAGYPVRIAISCKNERLPIKPNLINEFIGTLDEVGIPTEYGIFVCVNGYSSGALTRAQKAGIKTLVLRGLTKSRLTSEISKALQFNIYLLLIITNITGSDNGGIASYPGYEGQFLVFGNAKQEPYGTVLDFNRRSMAKRVSTLDSR